MLYYEQYQCNSMIDLHKVRLVAVGPWLVNTDIFTNMFFRFINHIGD